MNLFLINFFIIDLLLLVVIDAKLFLKRKQTFLLAVFFLISWFLYIYYSGDGLLFLLLFSLLKFFIVHKNYGTWILPLIVFLKNLLFLIVLLSLFRDLPIFLLGKVNYSSMAVQLAISLFMVLTFFYFYSLNIRIVHSFHLKESFYKISKKYKYSSIAIVSLFIIVIIMQEYLYQLNNKLALLIGLFLLFFCGSCLILFFLFMAKIIYLERFIQQLGESTKASEQSIIDAQVFKHDYKNILIVLRYYLEKHSYDEAEAYLTELTNYSNQFLENHTYVQIQKINNFPLRALITDMYNKFKNNDQQILFSVSCDIESLEIPMETIDFVRSVSILLTNAYEACLDQEKSDLSITIKNSGINTIIEVKNSVSNPETLSTILKKNFTTKKNHSGLGLTHLSNILKDYNYVDCFFEVTEIEFAAILSFKSHD